MRMLNPPHPGDFIRTEIIEAHGLTVTDAAEILGVSRPTLSTLLNAKGDLSGRHGPARRESLRREDGHADADAEFLRHRPHPPPRGQDPRPPLQGRSHRVLAGEAPGRRRLNIAAGVARLTFRSWRRK